MYKKSREDLIKEYKTFSPFSQEIETFYNLSHDEKANINTFSEFCKRHGGYLALLLSDDEICDNKELVLIAKKHGFYADYHLISERLLNDPEVALALAKCNQYEFTKIGKALRDDAKLMLEAIKINPEIYCSLPVKVKTNRDIVIEIARRDPYRLKFLKKIKKEERDAIFSDMEIARIVAEKNPETLFSCFNRDVFNDEEVMEKAFCLSDPKECKKRLADNPWALEVVNPKYWINDTKLIKKALGECGYLYEYLPADCKKDKKLAISAVSSYPEMLAFCPEELKDDVDVVNQAIQECSEGILEFASSRLKADFDIVLKAVSVDGHNLEFASDELKDNREIVLRAIDSYGGALEYASKRLQKDAELNRIAQDNM